MSSYRPEDFLIRHIKMTTVIEARLKKRQHIAAPFHYNNYSFSISSIDIPVIDLQKSLKNFIFCVSTYSFCK